MNENLDNVSAQMMAELQQDERFLPSAFWRDINDKNVAMLEADGLENFKRTVSQNYFNWMVDRQSPMFQRAYQDWRGHKTIWPWLTRIEKDIAVRLITGSVTMDAEQRRVYRLFVGFLWQIMLRTDKYGLHRQLTEPAIGNPIKIWRGTKIITQDLANSIIEANVIVELLQSMRKRPRVAEIGAGYGRLAHVYAATQPGAYFIFDIPPALYVSQWYLTRVLPDKRIFTFRPFEDFQSVEREIAAADICFFTANQITKFPAGYFDVIVSISTLPEMRPEQIELYLNLFERLSAHHIYLKQWKSWKNSLDGTDMRVEDYLLGDDWRLSLDQTDPIVPEFFNRVWQRG
jgi:putative sugar O-methyltransferase